MVPPLSCTLSHWCGADPIDPPPIAPPLGARGALMASMSNACCAFRPSCVVGALFRQAICEHIGAIAFLLPFNTFRYMHTVRETNRESLFLGGSHVQHFSPVPLVLSISVKALFFPFSHFLGNRVLRKRFIPQVQLSCHLFGPGRTDNMSADNSSFLSSSRSILKNQERTGKEKKSEQQD